MAKKGYTWRQPPYPADDSDKRWIDPTMLIVAQNANVDAAIGPLMDTLYEPIGAGRIATVFVHETLRELLIEKVRIGMTVMHRRVKEHGLYEKALRRINCLGAELVSMMQPDAIGFKYTMVKGSPLLVCDFNHSFFSVKHPTTIVTLHTYRNSQELSELAVTETLPFASAAVWCPKTAAAYEIALMLNVPAVYINCDCINLAPIVEQHQNLKSCSFLHNGYRYEVMVQQGMAKAIVFSAPTQLDKAM